VHVVSSVVLTPDPGPPSHAVIVCGPSDEYTVTVDANTNSFEIIEGPAGAPTYQAGTTALTGDIVIEEGHEE